MPDLMELPCGRPRRTRAAHLAPWFVYMFVLLSAAVASGNSTRLVDTITIGDKTYYRTECDYAEGLPLWMYTVCTDDDACILAGSVDLAYTVVMRRYSRWGVALHPFIEVANVFSVVVPRVIGPHTWVMAGSDNIYSGASCRICEYDQPLGEVFSISPVGHFVPRDACAIDGGVAVLMTEQVCDANCNENLYLRTFTTDGEPTSDLLPLATHVRAREYGWLCPLADGRLVVAVEKKDPYQDNHDFFFLVVDQDLNVTQGPQFVDDNGHELHARTLANGNILVHYSTHPDYSGAFIRTFSPALEPLTDPIPVNPQLRWFAANAHGEFVVAEKVQATRKVMAQLYEADGTPRADAFEIAIPPGPASQAIGGDSRIALGDDGTVYIQWLGTSGGFTYRLTTLAPFEPGDMNYDGLVNNFDIDPFVLALTDPEEYQQLYPELPYQFLGDLNFDGDFNNFDIDPFVDALTAP